MFCVLGERVVCSGLELNNTFGARQSKLFCLQLAWFLLRGFAAIGADADDSQQVLSDLEVVFGRHRILERFEFG